MVDLAPCFRLDDHCSGAADAVVTVVEYGDYQCPGTRAAEEVLVALRRRFGHRLRVIYRHFPLSTIHPLARGAAEAAEAAGQQGLFWVMHSALLAAPMRLAREQLREQAITIGLDPRFFDRDLNSMAVSDAVDQDLLSGADSGVVDTPAFFINGSRYRSPVTVADLHAALLAHFDQRPDRPHHFESPDRA